jgi:hypothetical protein
MRVPPSTEPHGFAACAMEVSMFASVWDHDRQYWRERMGRTRSSRASSHESWILAYSILRSIGPRRRRVAISIVASRRPHDLICEPSVHSCGLQEAGPSSAADILNQLSCNVGLRSVLAGVSSRVLLEIRDLVAARLKQLGDQTRPTGLMRGSEAAAGVAMKVLVKKNVVTKMWIMLEPVIVTACGAPALRVDEKQSRQAPFQLDGHVVDGHVAP